MSPVETFLPRVLAAALLLVSVSIFGALAYVTVAMARGAAVSPRAWIFPMTILAVGAVLMWLLSRKRFPMPLYLSTFTLWLLTTAFYFTHLGAFLPH